MPFEFVKAGLVDRKSTDRYRKKVLVEQLDGQHICVDGKRYVNFSSNDYLGLSQHPDLLKAYQTAADKYGSCSGGSSLVTGFQTPHYLLEEMICDWLKKPRCLLFSSGFAANVGTLHALGSSNTQIYLDKLSHASLIDGAFTSNAKSRRFHHNDMAHLAKQLSGSTSTDNLIVSEGVFSMDGDSAPVSNLINCAQAQNAWLYLDDAHSIGVVGDNGEGSTSFGKVDIVMATFGKALATSGAFVACEEELAEYLVNYSRHYIYSTAISPIVASATIKSIELAQNENWRRDKIKELSAEFISLLDTAVEILPTDSSIHAVVLGDEQKALFVSEKLKERGYWLSAIRPPTVPNGTSRLRVTICANHNSKEINELANCVNEVINQWQQQPINI